MYQGKFDSQNKQSQRSVYELVAERNAVKAAKSKAAPRQGTASQQRGSGTPAPQQRAGRSSLPGMESIPGRTAPTARATQSAGSTPGRASAAGKTSSTGRTPARTAPGAAAVAEAPLPKKKRTGTLVFYTVCMGFVFVFYTATFFGLKYLNNWLVQFESAQPTAKSAEVFEQYFTAPNWEQLYDLAGMTIGKDSFCQAMEEKVGSQTLSYAETSAGLSKDKKYVVLLGDETIGTFTLENQNPNQGDTDLPDWQLSSLEFKLERKAPFRIRLRQGHTALVNGEAFGEEHTIIKETSKAGDYLPVYVSAPAYITLEVSDLLTQPEVTILDASGNQVAVSYDGESRTFTEAEQAPELPQELEEMALNAVKTYASYMSTKTGYTTELAKYFDRDSEIYGALIKTERNWTQEGSSFNFTDESVTDYQVYSDEIFSVRVNVTLNITRKEDGSVKETPIRQTLFFSKNSSGKWSCFQMTAVDAAQLDTQVLLTFMEDETVLSSNFYDANAAGINCPLISAPEGKTFSGWMVEEQDEKGATVLRLVFQPDESGYVSLTGTTLEPMTLYPLFE
ncbi:MAG: hypothetical protein SPI15_10745 [Candidatus Faecousia sp.]|nr:hypothetical protein [Clostridiales bacterium]MDY6181309.1 hypothetical protein [Candidatus Faecousia sp.]